MTEKQEEVKWNGPYKITSVMIGEFDEDIKFPQTMAAEPCCVIISKSADPGTGTEAPRCMYVTRVENGEIWGYLTEYKPTIIPNVVIVK